MTHTTHAQDRWNSFVMPTYGTPKVVLDRGVGARVWDVDGKEYIDFVAGIAVNLLGHAHPVLIDAVTKQLSTLGHTSNLAAHEPGLQLAQKLVELAGGDAKVFFTNSGTEANEAAIKLSRLTGKTHIVSLRNSFHGRTVGSLTMTGQPKKYEPFLPLMPDVSFVDANDVEGLRAAITDKTAALWLEPIQGEGGVLPLTQEFMTVARELCTQHEALLVLDEVQTGIARTGSWFAFQQFDVVPDVLLLAKGLGAGIPIGACIGFGKYADLMTAGLHGTTFGGNAVSCAAGNAVLKEVEDSNLIKRALEIETAVKALEDLPAVDQVRGMGAMLGVVLTSEIAADVETRARELGLLVNACNASVLRLVPPLVVTDDDLTRAINILREAIGEISA